jgi:hypothetical protein
MLPMDVMGDMTTSEAAQELRTPAEYRTYWGDLHTHTNLSLDARAIGAGDTEDSIHFAIAESELDFLAITDHDILGLTRPRWESQQRIIEDYNEHGIIVFPGFEYTDPNEGHLNVFFRNSEEATLIRSGLRRDPNDLWSWLERRDADAITVPHHTALDQPPLPNYDWNSFSNADYQRVVEIYSQHGSSEASGDGETVEPFGEAGSVFSAYNLWLENGNEALKLGVIGSTDDHQTRPGGTWESEDNMEPVAPFNTAGGLVAVLAEPNASRDTLFDAIHAKRTYATTGERIGLTFEAATPSQQEMMGGTLLVQPGETITFNATATGDTAPINRIELIQNGEVIASSGVASADGTIVLNETVDVDVQAAGPRSWFMVKAYQDETLGFTNYDDDGELHLMEERAWSSPIFVEIVPESVISEVQRDTVQTLISNVVAMRSESQVTAAQIAQLHSDLAAPVNGVTRSDRSLVVQWVRDSWAARRDGELSEEEHDLLAADVDAILESANISQTKRDAVFADVDSIIDSSSVTEKDLETIGDDPNAIRTEFQNNHNRPGDRLGRPADARRVTRR